jgi:methionyl aminopeptidase
MIRLRALPTWRPARRLAHSFKRRSKTTAGKLPDFGAYSVLLSEEPFVFGVAHVIPRVVPPHIVRPPYAQGAAGAGKGKEKEGELEVEDPRVVLGSVDEVRLRAAAALARDVRELAGSLVKPGVTTLALDAAVHEAVVRAGAYPSPLHYAGFPRSCCTSVNNVIVHGIPDDRPLEDGDIVNVDVTVYRDGFHGDTSATFLVGAVDTPGRELVQVTHTLLDAGIAACAPGRPFTAIARAIAAALPAQYSISSQFTGHGIGRAFHRAPWIIHTPNEEPGVMRPGDCFTIEPCVVQGTDPRAWIFPDGWTASTENCARSAQAEHMVLITEDGAEVLTC